MPVTQDRKYTSEYVFHLLEGVKGKTLGEVDSSHQFKYDNHDYWQSAFEWYMGMAPKLKQISKMAK